MNIINGAPKEIQEAMNIILDTFGGGDGGMSFIDLCDMINHVSAHSIKEPNNESCDLIFDIITNFARLIKISRQYRNTHGVKIK